jgi:sugar/nucleoside kinase (ribokinase family)
MPDTAKNFLHGDRRQTAPVSVGAGFVALDRLLIGSDRVRANKQYAGGSCGNVMAILANFGWNSYPVARLGADRPAQLVIDDLRTCRVNTTFVSKERASVTPVVVLRVAEDKTGTFKSRFEWKDRSGNWLPRYRPLPKSHANRITPSLPCASVFYFDRAEASSLSLANTMRDNGAVIFFEPSSCKDDALFTACLAVSDVVKYSAQRIAEPPQNPVSRSPRLEVQTFGGAGLRYRLKMRTETPSAWRELAAFPVDNFEDATGCGDWCSAGMIAKLCMAGQAGFMRADETSIVSAIRFGQALAAINCGYRGARGPMYELSLDELDRSVEKLLTHDSSQRRHWPARLSASR